MDLGPKRKKKAPKKGEYREFQVKVGAARTELQAWADEAAVDEKRPKAQKLFKPKPNGFSGEESVDMTGIGKWVRDIVIPYYMAHKFEREAKKAEAMRRLEVATAEARAAGVREI